MCVSTQEPPKTRKKKKKKSECSVDSHSKLENIISSDVPNLSRDPENEARSFSPQYFKTTSVMACRAVSFSFPTYQQVLAQSLIH